MSNSTDMSLASLCKTPLLAFEVLVCVCGFFGSGVSLWCVKTCDKMQAGTKIQLCLLFGVNLFVCSLALPGTLAVEVLFLQGRRVERATEVAFRALYAISCCVEELALTVVAVYRLIAVCFPSRYNLWSRPTVVLAVETILVLLTVVLLVLPFFVTDSQGINLSRSVGGEVFNIIFYVLPTAINLVSYCTVIILMASRRWASGSGEARPGRWDQVSLSLSVLILMNLLLDVPHFTMHFLHVDWKEPRLLIAHALYRLLFALQPIVFVGLNARYRQKALKAVLALVPGRRVPPPPAEVTSGSPRITTALPLSDL
ncbi:uncharacterized protein LOC122245950 [Penaeus japonicus]|uniref:uncharacterized protein LOC122245950 n=1 Tax=Penaeus japonicus TaxID=27405 RepID=UPI001C70E0FD|nr:uncharacterized protein LOC122245950 [Penaeus japonicus]